MPINPFNITCLFFKSLFSSIHCIPDSTYTYIYKRERERERERGERESEREREREGGEREREGRLNRKSRDI